MKYEKTYNNKIFTINELICGLSLPNKFTTLALSRHIKYHVEIIHATIIHGSCKVLGKFLYT